MKSSAFVITVAKILKIRVFVDNILAITRIINGFNISRKKS